MTNFIETLYQEIALWQAHFDNLYTLLAITKTLNAYPREWLIFKYSSDASAYADFYNKINAIVLATDIDGGRDGDNKMSEINIIPTYQLIHYDLRFHLNKQPLSLNALLRAKGHWKLLGIPSSAYHMHGINGEYNLKFISQNGYFEAVYSSLTSQLILDPWNIGTYNFANPSDWGHHYTYDVEPYYKWNNTPALKGQGQLGANLLAAENIVRYEQSAHAQENYNKIKSLF